MVKARMFWCQKLDRLNRKYDMGTDLWNWNDKHLKDFKEMPLGGMKIQLKLKKAY